MIICGSSPIYMHVECEVRSYGQMFGFVYLEAQRWMDSKLTAQELEWEMIP